MIRSRYILAIIITILTLSTLLSSCQATNNSGGTEHYRVRPLPESAQVLFLSNRDTGTGRMEVYSMDAQGGSITRITTTDEQHFVFGIDSSQRYVVATRGTENRKRLWLLDLQTGAETPLTGKEDNAEGRSFSPDGEWIVFWMVPARGIYSDIYKIRRDGTGLVNLTNTPQAHEFDPAWSNRGDQIAFIYDSGQPNRFVLRVMDTDGTNVSTIYDPTDAVDTTLFPAGVYDPSWSPNDDWILVEKPVQFSADGENGGAGVWHIIEVSVYGTVTEDLTQASELVDCAMYLPSFSPDGQWIILSARCGPEAPSQVSLDIYKMSPDGTNIQKLTSSSYWAQFPVWLK